MNPRQGKQATAGSSKGGAKGKAANEPVATQITKHILKDHHARLGIEQDPRTWPGHLVDKCHLKLGTARNHLKGRISNRRTLEALAALFSTLPEFASVTFVQLRNARSLKAFLDETESGLQVELRIRRRGDINQIAEELVGLYVCYRHAFDPGALNNQLTREVLVINRDGNRLPMQMSYKLGIPDAGQRHKLFDGEAMPLGEVAMCVGTSTALNNPKQASEWRPEWDRGRSLFFRRRLNEQIDPHAKFGILSSTVTDGGFEPCSACVLLTRVHDWEKRDLDKFMQEVTVIQPIDDMLKKDFAGIPPRQYKWLKIFLQNIPRRIEAGVQDQVLKLWHDRFRRYMVPIMQLVHANNKVVTPFKANWP